MKMQKQIAGVENAHQFAGIENTGPENEGSFKKSKEYQRLFSLYVKQQDRIQGPWADLAPKLES